MSCVQKRGLVETHDTAKIAHVNEPMPFEEWLTAVAETPQDVDPAWLRWLRDTYALRGPISNDELQVVAFDAWTTHAEEAFPHVLADFVMEPVTEELWSGWPVCSDDGYGLDAELADGRAIWRCRSPRHELVARIGELGLPSR